MLEVHPSVPAKNLKEFLALAKADPSGLGFASAGNGTPQHLAGELFNTAAGLKLQHIPYKGAGPALIDVLGGHVKVMFDILGSSVQYIKTAKLRPIAVTTATRSPALPDVPTMAEAGLPGYDIPGWHGIAAPAATPKPIINQLNKAINEIFADPEFRKRWEELGTPIVGGTPEAFGALVKVGIGETGQAGEGCGRDGGLKRAGLPGAISVMKKRGMKMPRFFYGRLCFCAPGRLHLPVPEPALPIKTLPVAAGASCRLDRPAGGSADRAAGLGAVLRNRACRFRRRRLKAWKGVALRSIQLEHADHLRQVVGLLLHRSGGGGRFFDQRGVLLGDLVHLGDRLVDLLDAGALLLAGGGDLAHDVGDALHAGDDFLHRRAGLRRPACCRHRPCRPSRRSAP